MSENEGRGLNWGFLGVAVGIVGLSAGVAWVIGTVITTSTLAFDGMMLLIAFLGVVLISSYLVGSTRVVIEPTLTSWESIPGRASDSESILDHDEITLLRIVLFIGLGFLIAGVVGLAQ